MSYVGYKCQPLDFMVYQNGDVGPMGRSIVSSTRYYALVLKSAGAPSKPDSKPSATEFEDKDGVKWSTSPEAFSPGCTYYETTLTIYNANDDNGEDFAWSEPTAQTILDVDFINSLGITARKIEVLDNLGATVFKADGFIDKPEVQLGGFNVTADKLTAGSGNGYISLQTTQDPLEYTPAEYIEFSGTQYIDTGVVMDYDTDVVEITVQPTVADQNGMFFGVWDAENSVGEKTAVLYHYGTSGGTKTIMFYVGGGKIQNLNSGISTTDLTKHTYRFEKKTNYELSVDGITKAVTETDWTIDPESSHTSCIGAAYRPSGTAGWHYKGKIYSCKIWRGGQLYRDFIPVWKDGYGLYDNCFGKFYSNNGTGKIGGALGHSLDATFTLNGTKYTRLDYIQNNGIDNYIDTGLSLNFGTGFTVEAEIMTTAPLAPDDRCCILSSYASNDADSNNNFSFELYELNGNDQVRAYINHGHPDYQFGEIQENTKYNIKYSVTSSNVKITLNGGMSGDQTFGSALTGNINASPYIFVDRMKRFDTFDTPLRLYSMKIYSGGSLIAHYLPVLNNVQIPGLVNIITGQFLTTPLGSPFTYATYSPKGGRIFVNGENSYRALEYIESPEPESDTKGTYIDTGIKSTSTTAIEIDAMAFSTRSYYGGTVDNSYNCTIGGTWNNYFYCNGNTQFGISSTSVKEVRTVLKQDGANCYRDGIKVDTATNTLPNDTATIILCARRNGTEINDVGKFRIFACRLWENGSLVRDFIPVIKNETTYGLYDVVNNNFHEPSNSTGFTGKFTGKGYASEFTAFYLGDTDPEIAPFSVTNTGKLKAESGTIGGFELSETGIKSNNGNLQLGSDGTIVAKGGELGGFIIGDGGATKPLLFTRSHKTSENGELVATATSGLAGLDNPNHVVFWAGSAKGLTPWELQTHEGDYVANTPFFVTSQGYMHSTSGTIGGFKISNNSLESDHLKLQQNKLYLLDSEAGISLKSESSLTTLNSSGIHTDIGNFEITAGKEEYRAGFSIDATGSTTLLPVITAKFTASTDGRITVVMDSDHLHPTDKITKIKVSATIYYQVKNDGFLWGAFSGWSDTYRVETATFDISQPNQSETIVLFSGGINTDRFNKVTFSLSNISSGIEDHCYPEGAAGYIENFTIENNEKSSQTQTRKIQLSYHKTRGNVSVIGAMRPITDNAAQLGDALHSFEFGYFTNLVHSSCSCTASDQKVKNTIEYDISKYDKVFDTLRPASYKYNNGTSDRTHLGFIAQDIQESISQAELADKDCAIVVIDGDGFDKTLGKVVDEEKTSYYVRYGELHALEVRQIQLLKQEVKELKAEIEELKSKQI
jgi:hypothetical protein